MLISAFLFGLISSLHCIGMCGPIALVLPIDHHDRRKKVTQILTYQFGRITTYGSLGLLFGIVGRTLYLAGFQQRLSIIAGIVMLILAIVPERRLAKYNLSGPVFRIVSKIRTALGSRLRNKSYKSIFTVGILNGMLPCGMVYAALFGSLAMQDVGNGILFMVLFGLGTIPLMSVVPIIQGMLTVSFRSKVRKAIPFAVGFIGVLFICRGLGLGIPYLSPSEMSLFIQAAPNCG